MLSIGWHNITMSEYHGDVDTYSKSSLSEFIEKGALKFRHQRLNPFPKKSKSHFDVGEATHKLLLEGGEEYEKSVAITPKEVLAKDGSKHGHAYKEWAQEQNGKIILKQRDADLVKKMAESVLSKNTARELITGGVSEISGVFEHPKGVRVKIRPDHMPCGDIITDLKTSKSWGGSGIAERVYNFRYHWSDYISILGAKILGHDCRYVFVDVDKDPPHDVAIYELADSMRDAAVIEVESVISDLAECIKNGVWPGHPDAVQKIDAPDFIKRRYSLPFEFD